MTSHLRAVFVYSLAEKKTYQLSDGLADAISPAFDAGGKYIYFLASTDYGPRTGWLEMSSVDRPVRRAIYLAVLSGDPSPLLPETGDEPRAAPATNHAANPRRGPYPTRRMVAVRIDFDGSDSESWPSMFRAGDYSSLAAGAAGTIFYMEPITPGGGPASLRLQRYQSGSARPRPSSKASALHALGGQEEAALSGRRKSLGNRCDRPPRQGGRRRNQRGADRDAG